MILYTIIKLKTNRIIQCQGGFVEQVKSKWRPGVGVGRLQVLKVAVGGGVRQ